MDKDLIQTIDYILKELKEEDKKQVEDKHVPIGNGFTYDNGFQMGFSSGKVSALEGVLDYINERNL